MSSAAGGSELLPWRKNIDEPRGLPTRPLRRIVIWTKKNIEKALSTLRKRSRRAAAR